jgi:hypothetical protein
MDGRVQLPVLQWIKANYPVDFVDVITEAGMDAVLSNQKDIGEILRSIAISVNVNRSARLFIVGHHDCRGNPVEEKVHRQQIRDSVDRLKSYCPKQEIVGLWVNDSWSVEVISKSE